MSKEKLTENKAEATPTGGVLVGKREGQTMIHNKGSLSGYLVGRTHAEGGIKAVNKSTGQPLEMQGGEVVITAPAVSDNTKREFEGKMMTNREILSEINKRGGGVSFAEGGDVPTSMKHTGATYKYGGKTMTDHDIMTMMNGGGHLAKGMSLKQIAKMHNVPMSLINKQVELGLKAESEHTNKLSEQMKIVKDHLYEKPNYYTLLKKAGLEDGGLLKAPNVNHTDLRGKEFTFQNGKFLIVDFPNKQGAWKKGASFRQTFKHFTSVIKLDNVKTDLDSLLYKKFQKPYFVYDDFFNQFENKPSLSLDGNYKKMIDTLNYELKSYATGGRVYRGSLVRDAKSGNTPARDLNNYNDVLDMDADGMVGADSGIYADGGSVNSWDKEDVTIVNGEYLKRAEVVPSYKDDTMKGEYFVVFKNEKGKIVSSKDNFETYNLALKYAKENVNNNQNYATGGDIKPYDANMEGDSVDNMVGAETGLFDNGGMFNTEPFLNYYFDEIAEFLKYQNNITLNKDFTFKYKGELFRVEPIILSEKNIKKAYFSIIDSEDEEVGEIKFNPNDKKEFFAYSNYFEWNNLKFNYGGDVKPYDANMEGDSANMTYDDGGATELPKVHLLKISSTGSSLSALTGKEFYNFRELKEGVEAVYKTLNQNIKSTIYVMVNGIGISMGTYISAGKNTVANFNPYTGKPSDLEKVFTKRHRYTFNKYDWSEWFGTQEKAKTTRGKKASTQTPTSKPASTASFTQAEIEVFKEIESILIDHNLELVNVDFTFSENTRNFQIENPVTKENYYLRSFKNNLGYADDSSNQYGTNLILDKFIKWKASTPASSGKAIDLNRTKIWIGDNPELSRRVQERAFELGWGNKADGVQDINKNTIFFNTSKETVSLKMTREDFDGYSYKEITETDLFGTSTSASTEKEEVLVKEIIITYELNNEKRNVNCYSILELKNSLDYIQQEANNQYVTLSLQRDNQMPHDFDIWISDTVKDKGDFNPKNSNEAELKTLLKDWFYRDDYNWSLFFKDRYGNATQQEETPTTSEPVKSNRNFELERKYLTGRINELSKELDMKRPSLLNEEIAFYQREINKFILKLRKVMNDQNEEKPITERIEAVYGLKWGDYDKQYPETDLVAYNGVKSELTNEEYLTVRTPEFKAFFGDWEQGSSAGFSKVINPKTKEPLAVFHGTNVLFTEWKTYATNNAHYFSTKRDFSEFFASEWENRTDRAGVDSKVLKDLNPNKGKFLFRCFIDVRNPIDFSRFGVDKRPISDYLTFLKINYNIGDYDFWTGLGNASGITKDTKVYAWQIIRLWQNFTTYVKLYTTYDGYIFYEYNPNTPTGGVENASLCFCAFESNQVKFTNAYEFNALSNDSRFDFGGEI
jgi:hypothetical protein